MDAADTITVAASTDKRLHLHAVAAAAPINAEIIEGDLGDSQDSACADEQRRKNEGAPTLDPAALHGLPGEVVRTIGPSTEADPAALLVTFLAAAGCMIGPGPHAVGGDTEHPAKVWPLICGRTAGGMKGTSYAAIRKVIGACDDIFLSENVDAGLTSGEGLIERVRDPDDPEIVEKPHPGVPDKRVLIVETEFASVLARSRREGSTLGQNLRQAWDGPDLRTMARKSNRLRATGAHIVLVAHITPSELLLRVSDSDLAGGLLNRFLVVYSRRSKRLPFGGGADHATLTRLGDALRLARFDALKVTTMTMTAPARDLWTEVYADLTPDDLPDGPLAAVVARGVPQTLRLAVTYALLDRTAVIDVEHVRAALAVWRYVHDSAAYVFGRSTGDPDLDRLVAAVEQAGDAGLSKTDISGLYGRNRDAAHIEYLLDRLLAQGCYERITVATGGRPAERYRRTAAPA